MEHLLKWWENTLLEYKADWYGRTIVVAPTNYASSQLCSECGYKNIDVKKLSIERVDLSRMWYKTGGHLKHW